MTFTRTVFSRSSSGARPEEGSGSGLMRPVMGEEFESALGLLSSSSEDDEDVQFDTSDMDSDREVLMAGRSYSTVQEFASAIPNHLLLGSLLEHLCFVYENNPARSRKLFKVIGQRLAAMNLLSPLAISDEFSTVRLQHNRAFTELLHAANSSLYQESQILGTTTQSTTVRPKEGLFQAQTSRYLSEFEEKCRLGKGSYGNVFKVLNKLDGQDYAVKKIRIKKVSKEDCMKVLREVKVLSSLQHVNIVGYHTAWMEHVQPAAYSRSSLPALESPEQHDSSDENCHGNGTGSSLPSKEQSDSKCPAMGLDSSVMFEEGSSSNVELSNGSCSGKECQQKVDKCPITIKEVQFHLMLYIQMQLCERSLKDWISERNAKPVHQQCPFGCVDTEHTLSILKQILDGVQYIHSRGIIHRDLKPRNIFLTGQGCHVSPRIGDFGLACRNLIADSYESSGSLCSDSSHTTAVGTFVYASPEQLKGSHYDSKSDMYSVGILAYELFHPFGTEMERVQCLVDLRDGKIPDSFNHRWPILAEYVMKLTNKDASIRPTSTELLNSKLFSSTDMTMIHGLQKQLKDQEKEIMQLRRRISELESSNVSFSESHET
uniref:Eukaryotic translation initiation factor 2-alpha kinase 1 n=1 Tax=Knipowitschia caucasica TaxID=637954 RepID=A0AAV2L9P1_KNICA